MDKFRHSYVRYEALLAQLHAEAGVGHGGAPPPPLLPRLAAAFDDGGGGGDAAALLGPCLNGSGGGAAGFERSFLQEVLRLRLFVKSSLEQLWLALLDACAQTRGLGEELLQVGGAA